MRYSIVISNAILATYIWYSFCIYFIVGVTFYVSITIDKYLGYHYYINSVILKSKHKKPYVAVSTIENDTRVALIYIETQEIDYYSNTPSEVKRDEDILKMWIEKNHQKCVKTWNRLNPNYPAKGK